jgi:tRNA U34 5-methylaminomethyl-2-thiouridine-forming methyltransferase MnmC
VEPYLGSKIKDEHGDSVLSREYVDLSRLENDGFYEHRFDDVYGLKVNPENKTATVFDMMNRDYGKKYEQSTISIALFIALLQKVATEQEEFEKDKEAYEQKVKIGEKVFEVTENDVDLEKMMEDFRQEHNVALEELRQEKEKKDAWGKFKFW